MDWLLLILGRMFMLSCFLLREDVLSNAAQSTFAISLIFTQLLRFCFSLSCCYGEALVVKIFSLILFCKKTSDNLHFYIYDTFAFYIALSGKESRLGYRYHQGISLCSLSLFWIITPALCQHNFTFTICKIFPLFIF